MLSISSKAQVKLDDFGRIVLNSYIADKAEIPTEAKSYLITKLNQISSSNGIGGSNVNPRFIITATISVLSKDIVAGPPQMIAQNLSITLYIGDAITNTVFTNTTINTKGVGTNENKALIDAIKAINPNASEMVKFVEEGKNKILSYYTSQCDFILKKASSLSDQLKYDEAIYELMIVPETCKDCYFKSNEEATVIFNKKIERACTEKLKEAKLVWAAEPTEDGAIKASEIMQTIIPSDHCRAEMLKLSEEIKHKMKADQQKKYDFEMLEMQKKYDTEKERVVAEKEIALEQAKNQPKTLTYNNIYWR